MSSLSAHEQFVGMKEENSRARGNGGGLAYRVVIVFGLVVCAAERAGEVYLSFSSPSIN